MRNTYLVCYDICEDKRLRSDERGPIEAVGVLDGVDQAVLHSGSCGRTSEPSAWRDSNSAGSATLVHTAQISAASRATGLSNSSAVNMPSRSARIP